MTAIQKATRPTRWHIGVLLAPALILYTIVMVVPIANSLRLSFFQEAPDGSAIYAGWGNYARLFGDALWSEQFWNAFRNNLLFFAIHMAVQNPIGIVLAALLSLPWLRLRGTFRTVFFLPAMLSFVIVGFAWRLILSPAWGISRSLLAAVGLGHWFAPWLGQTGTALPVLALVSVWQNVGIPMMLIYAAILSIPDELIEAAECDGITGFAQFFRIKLPLLWPSVGIISILTFVGNFNSFDVVYVSQGPLAGPDGATDLFGTFLFRTFFGNTLQPGDPFMGAAIASVMFLIILGVIVVYLFGVQRRLTYHTM